VSVLFADLVGFTPFAEERDAEDVRETLTRYFDLARDVIERYGGTVEKFIGDAVMAVWGAPTAREDDAERAVRAALELVDVVRTLGSSIQARAGVLTGEAAVTLGATNQGLVAGDLVNTASRLQSAAPPGAVLVGEATQRSASGAIAFEPAGEQTLKGKQAPVAAWRALRVVANRGGQGRSDLPEPPFVGRDEEVRVLKDALTAQARDPRVRVVSITGPAGIGKSRLAWEFEKYVDGLVETVYWHRGRSPSYGEGITFWALGEMVRQRAGLAESDDEATTRERIAAAVAQYVASDEDRRWVGPALLALLGIGEAPAGGRDVLFAAWRIFFERIAAGGTTVLLFEDLHWADSGLLEFIDHLIEWARGVPLLIVTLARPELFERRPTWGAGQRHFTSIALEPLPDHDMRDLLHGFVPGLPAHAVEAILARADGIPLYAVETVRALVGSGRLREVNGAYQPVGDFEALAIPETLQSLIASRLDSLSAEDRALVQDAAVLGQSFAPAALAAVSGTSEPDLEARLRGLVRRELLELRVDPRSPERGQYAFVQSLIREVAYATLARRDRRARHLAVARYFEGLGDEELAGALANHYLAAYQASTAGPEAEAVGIQARLALRAAAARAAGLGAHEQAIALLRQAIDVTADPADRAPLLAEAASSADAASLYEAGRELATRAVADYETIGDHVGTARARALLGRVLIDDRQIQQAVDALQLALEDLPDEGVDEARALVLTTLSRAYMRTGDTRRSIEAADLALALAERLDLEELIADAFNNKGSSLGYLGRHREAVALMEAAVAVAHASGHLAAELRARTNLAGVTWENDPARAAQINWEVYELGRRLGVRTMANWALGNAASGSWLSATDWDRALAELEEARQATEAGSDVSSLAGSIANFRLARDEPIDDLMAIVESGLESSDPGTVSSVHFLRGSREMLNGDPRRAIPEFESAAVNEPLASIFIAEAMHAGLWAGDLDAVARLTDQLSRLPRVNTRVGQTDLSVGRIGLAVAAGRRKDAIAATRDAFAAYVGLGYDLLAARTVIGAVRVMGPDEPELRPLIADARRILERVRATAFLRLLDAAVDGGSEQGIRPSPAGPATVAAHDREPTVAT
jgi:class 3 adenylate cyclase/tetratricopeptide (TPR) repeat protein